MNRNVTLAIFVLASIALVLSACGGGAGTQDLKRDYSFHGSIKKMAPSIFPPDDSSWVKVDDTTRRKVFFNDRLTLEIVETTKSALTSNITTRHRFNDLIGYIITGSAMITVGKNIKQISAGGVFVVPSNTPYGVIPASDKTIILNVYTPPREDLRPTAPAVRHFSDNEIKSIVYGWFALFDENASADKFLSYLADTGLTMVMSDKKKISSWQDFQQWHTVWSSAVETCSSTLEKISVSFDDTTGKYLASAVVSSTIKTLKGKKSSERYRVDIVLVDNSWGDTPKIIQYTETKANSK